MKALFDYYPESSVRAAGYQTLRYVYAGQQYRMPAISPLDGRGLRIPLLAGCEHIEDTVAPDAPVLDPSYGPRYIERLKATGCRLWDDDLYCLTDFRVADGSLHTGIGMGKFLAYRLSVGLLREELAIAEETGDWRLPLRDRIAPDAGALTDFSKRLCGGGVHMMCAFRRAPPDDDYVILLQRRSALVSEAGGSYGLVPMAYHQPPRHSCAPFDPRSPAVTALRELYEEVFGGEEETRFLDHPAIEWLLDHGLTNVDGRIHFECTSFWVSLVGGNYEFGAALLVSDADYWGRFASLVRHGWESSAHLLVSSRDAGRIGELLTSDKWEGQALGTFIEGLRLLREIDPIRVADLPLENG